MGLVQNLKKKLNNWVDKVLVELSYHYIKQRAKQTFKKPDNSLLKEHLTEEPSAPIVEEPASEKITMNAQIHPLAQVKEWYINRINELAEGGVESQFDAVAIVEEFYEWIDAEENGETLKYVSLMDPDFGEQEIDTI